MAQTLLGQVTTASYPSDGQGGCQLGPSSLGTSLDLVAGNAPCLVQVATVIDPSVGPSGGYQYTQDIPIVAGDGQIATQSFINGVGFKAKDLTPGIHSTVFATLWEKGDPLPVGGNSFAGSISSGGVIPPPVPDVDLPSVQLFSFGSPQVVANNTPTILNTATNGILSSNGTGTFSFDVPSSTIQVITTGWYTFALRVNFAGGDIQCAVWVSSGILLGNQIPSSLSSSLFASKNVMGAERVAAGVPAGMTANFYQTSGGNVTVNDWSLIATQISPL